MINRRGRWTVRIFDYLLGSHDVMVYEIKKPYVENPYTFVVHNFSERGVKNFLNQVHCHDELNERTFLFTLMENLGVYELDEEKVIPMFWRKYGEEVIQMWDPMLFPVGR